MTKPLNAFVQSISMCHVAARVEEALEDSKWTQAIKDEMEALIKNMAWNLVPLSKAKKIVGVQVGVFC